MKQTLRAFYSDFLLSPLFGIYVIEDPSIATSIMLDNATMAVKSIQEDYINGYAYYVDEFHKTLAQEQKIIEQMEQALENEEFEVWFQPKYCAKDQKICSAEALVRWMHPDSGLMLPGEFIHIFERNGFIQKLDKYVWNKTCSHLKKWKEMNLNIQPISVNVSRANLYSRLIEKDLLEIVTTHGIPAHYMPLEITESVFVKDVFLLNDKITKLKDMGFSIQMDDFGSGFSSLNVLKDVSIDTLKIDMEFFSDTKHIDKSKVIVASVVQMAKNLGLLTVAEGVERQTQADFLRAIDVDVLQGFLYAKPMPAKEYEMILKEIK